MLKSVEVGREPKEDTLVITPEFFTYIRKVANRSWGASISLRFYPCIYQWIVIRDVSSTPDECGCFDVDRVPVLIPKKQQSVFVGKVLGYEMVVPGFLLIGFMRGKT
jgi:hypothetical protein